MQKTLFTDGYFVYYQDNASPHKTMDGNKNTLFSSIFMRFKSIENILSILKNEVEKRHLGLVINFKIKKSGIK